MAQNQPLILQFNQAINPASVNSGSVSIRTSTGEEPVGKLLVNGNTIEFVPEVRISGSETFFGFRPNATYQLYLPAGEGQTNVLRSTTGHKLSSPISCTLDASLGIVDLNEAPPQARLVTPTQVSGAPKSTVIELRFNEIIDRAPFIGATAANAPIKFVVKKTQETSPGVFECRSSSQSVVLSGQPRISEDLSSGETVVSFTPEEELPGNACVEVQVSAKVVDLAGVAARPQALSFTTIASGVEKKTVVEAFANVTTLDASASGGTWGGNKLTFFQVGGDGSLGEFDPTIGSKEIKKDEIYEWSTDSHTIPPTQTLDGVAVTVTNGVFFFTKFVVPPGVEVRFVGKNPARIHVAGEVELGASAKLVLNGESLTGEHEGDSKTGEQGSKTGEGGQPGPGGGAGGKGGDSGDGKGAVAANNGQDGKPMTLASSHAYASSAASAVGKGSRIFPVDGKKESLKYPLYGLASAQASSPGGGGANRTAGGALTGTWSNSNYKNDIDKLVSSGKALPWGTSTPNGVSSMDHWLVGGAGGGGAGASALGGFDSGSPFFYSGRAGGGGGGAVGISAGGRIIMGKGSSIQCRGGSASGNYNGSSSGSWLSDGTGPGGGGAGGSVLLQTASSVSLAGTIDVTGGLGGVLNTTLGTDKDVGTISLLGGKGGNGVIRLETLGTPNVSMLGTTLPAATANDVAKLTDASDYAVVRSRWYAASTSFVPDYVRYEIEAVVDGKTVIYSDDPKVGLLAKRGSTPLIFKVLGAKVERKSSGLIEPIDANSVRERWRDYVGPFQPTGTLQDDGATGFRFVLILDRTFKSVVEVKKVTICYKI